MQKTFGLCSVLKAHHKIVGITVRSLVTAHVAKDAIEKWLGRVREEEFASNQAKYPDSVAFKADDKFYLLLFSCDAYSMARVETRRNGSLILSDRPLKTRNEPLASSKIVDNDSPYDPKSVIIHSGS